MSKYINLINPSKEDISSKILEGYQPFSVTKKFDKVRSSGGFIRYQEVPVVTMVKATSKKIEELVITSHPDDFEDYTLFASLSMSNIISRYQSIIDIESDMVFVMVKRAKVERGEA